MSFLDKAKKAAQDAKDKTTEIIEVSKVNKQIGQQEDKIKETYVLMGKQVFSNFMNGIEITPDLKVMCEEIVAAKETTEELRKQILVIKNIKICPTCKTEMELIIAFCPKCGTKQPEQE
jgi:hypothetical protein